MKKSIIIPSVLLALYFVIGVVEFASVTINQTDKISDYVLSTLWPLIVALGVLTTVWTILSYDRYKYKRVRIALNSLLYTFIFSLLHFGVFQGYVSLINRKMGDQHLVEVNGKIADITSQSSSGTTRYYLTINEESGQVLKLKAPKEIAKTYQINGDFSLIMTKGCLGFLYIK